MSKIKLLVGLTAATLALSAGAAAGAASAATATKPDLKSSVSASGKQVINGLEVLARDCSGSKLQPHTGFQIGPACVSTADGEVSELKKNPTLLITKAPDKIRSGQDFTLTVSTRNLVRDRFLGAAAGGYYLESSILTADGIQRGHFHTACDVMDSDDVAPQPQDKPKFFVATEDGKGGKGNSSVKIKVPGKDPITGKVLFKPGDMVRCAAWAGDGSHRIPQMQFAKEVPAFDSVRLEVKGKM